MNRLLMTLPFLLLVGEATALEKHESMDMTLRRGESRAPQSEGKASLRYPSKVDGMMRYGMFPVDGRCAKTNRLRYALACRRPTPRIASSSNAPSMAARSGNTEASNTETGAALSA